MCVPSTTRKKLEENDEKRNTSLRNAVLEESTNALVHELEQKTFKREAKSRTRLIFQQNKFFWEGPRLTFFVHSVLLSARCCNSMVQASGVRQKSFWRDNVMR